MNADHNTFVSHLFILFAPLQVKFCMFYNGGSHLHFYEHYPELISDRQDAILSLNRMPLAVLYFEISFAEHHRLYLYVLRMTFFSSELILCTLQFRMHGTNIFPVVYTWICFCYKNETMLETPATKNTEYMNNLNQKSE